MHLVSDKDPILHTPCQPFDFKKHNVTEIVNEMVEVMFSKDGIGLAGPQVGFPYNIFVMRWTDESAIGIINPMVTNVSDEKEYFLEGCLSYHGLYLNINRPKTCEVNFTTVEEKVISAKLDGIHARCFLHEYDHLQGVNFVDHVSTLKLNIAKRKQRKFTKKQNAYNKR